MIYADTQLEWMLSAFGCWHNGCTVATCYATLGEDGALFAMAQSKCKVVFADAKLLKVLANIADKLKKTLKERGIDKASIELGVASARHNLEALGKVFTALGKVFQGRSPDMV